jgi:hypothetical protein
VQGLPLIFVDHDNDVLGGHPPRRLVQHVVDDPLVTERFERRDVPLTIGARHRGCQHHRETWVRRRQSNPEEMNPCTM